MIFHAEIGGKSVSIESDTEDTLRMLSVEMSDDSGTEYLKRDMRRTKNNALLIAHIEPFTIDYLVRDSQSNALLDATEAHLVEAN